MNEKPRDCLNTIRLVAALQVVWNHASAHLHLSCVGVGSALGFFSGVTTFFVLSGFLIWMSIGRSSSFGEYGKKRFWRIYPELWIAVFVELFVLLVLFTDAVNWSKLALFAVGQATIFPFWTPEFLRGYGCGTPNGSLLTIFALVQFYILAYPTYRILHGKGVKAWIVVLGAFVALSVVFNYMHDFLPVNLDKLLSISFVPYYWIFLLGAFASEYKDKLLPTVLKYWYVPVCCRIAMIAFDCPDGIAYNYGLLMPIIMLLSVLAIGYKFPILNVKTDISYGIYIYHMTIVNAMIALGFGNGGGAGKYMAVVAITCAVSYISTITIGRFALMMKKGNKQ